jgi:lysyl-tRNA synthetase class 2
VSDWRPTSGPEVATQRAELLSRARQYFTDNKVLAVDTPTLSSAAATDPHISSLSAGTSDLFLHSSPEFHMKRLLAGGYPDIYSICRVYRDGEQGRNHLPEFTMIEWYRLAFDLNGIIDDTLRFIEHVLEKTAVFETAVNIEYAQAFVENLGVDPLTTSVGELAEIAEADAALRASLGDNRDDWLDLIMATKIVPLFGRDHLTVVQHYPASQAALARICPSNDRFADRFEIYCGALELANGYVELTDAQEQAVRMDRDLKDRQARGLPTVPRDEQLIAALTAGLPDCAGVALGFERLHMLAANTDDIRNVVGFA